MKHNRKNKNKKKNRMSSATIILSTLRLSIKHQHTIIRHLQTEYCTKVWSKWKVNPFIHVFLKWTITSMTLDMFIFANRDVLQKQNVKRCKSWLDESSWAHLIFLVRMVTQRSNRRWFKDYIIQLNSDPYSIHWLLNHHHHSYVKFFKEVKSFDTLQ